MACGGRVYKGDTVTISVPFEVDDYTNLTITYSTLGDNVITKTQDEVEIEDGFITYTFEDGELDLLPDGVIYYTITCDVNGVPNVDSTNTNLVLKTPAGYSGRTAEGIYQEGYNDGLEACSGETPDCSSAITQAYQEGYEQGLQDCSGETPDCSEEIAEAYQDGYSSGTTDGYAEGEVVGKAAGYSSGYTDGYNQGQAECSGTPCDCSEEVEEAFQSGYTAGQSECDCSSEYNTGYNEGYAQGQADCPSCDCSEEVAEAFQSGYTSGVTDGYSSGYSAGMADCSGYTDCSSAITDAYSSGWTDGYSAANSGANIYGLTILLKYPITTGADFHAITDLEVNGVGYDSTSIIDPFIEPMTMNNTINTSININTDFITAMTMMVKFITDRPLPSQFTMWINNREVSILSHSYEFVSTDGNGNKFYRLSFSIDQFPVGNYELGYESGYSSGYTDGQADCPECDCTSAVTEAYNSGFTAGEGELHTIEVVIQTQLNYYAPFVPSAVPKTSVVLREGEGVSHNQSPYDQSGIVEGDGLDDYIGTYNFIYQSQSDPNLYYCSQIYDTTARTLTLCYKGYCYTPSSSNPWPDVPPPYTCPLAVGLDLVDTNFEEWGDWSVKSVRFNGRPLYDNNGSLSKIGNGGFKLVPTFYRDEVSSRTGYRHIFMTMFD